MVNLKPHGVAFNFLLYKLKLSMNAVMCFEIRPVDFAGVKSVSTAIITSVESYLVIL